MWSRRSVSSTISTAERRPAGAFAAGAASTVGSGTRGLSGSRTSSGRRGQCRELARAGEHRIEARQPGGEHAERGGERQQDRGAPECPAERPLPRSSPHSIQARHIRAIAAPRLSRETRARLRFQAASARQAPSSEQARGAQARVGAQLGATSRLSAAAKSTQYADAERRRTARDGRARWSAPRARAGRPGPRPAARRSRAAP